MRDEVLDLFLDIFKFLRPSALGMHGSHSLDKYLIMLDECVHSTEGSLERREPIGRLSRDIEKHLHTIRNPSPFFWGRRAVDERAIMQGYEPTHFGLDLNYIPRVRSLPDVAFQTGTFAGATERGISGCPQISQPQQPQADTATIIVASGVNS